jgi:hypothetical protein
MTSLRQVEANRRNAQKSTGPRTEEGKERSRRNALKHGLSGAGLVVPEEEAEAINERFNGWNSSLKPGNAYEMWLAEVMAIETIRVDSGLRHDLVLRQLQTHRARVCWDDDRRLDAEELGAQLSGKPELFGHQLKRTAQGCEWLVERWRTLAAIVQDGKEWTTAQRSMALDLLGAPRELRDVATPLDSCQEPAAISARIEAEVARLQKRKADFLDELDERERTAAELGLGTEVSKPLALVRRYLAASMRRVQWAWDQFKKGRHTWFPGPGHPDHVPNLHTPARPYSSTPMPSAGVMAGRPVNSGDKLNATLAQRGFDTQQPQPDLPLVEDQAPTQPPPLVSAQTPDLDQEPARVTPPATPKSMGEWLAGARPEGNRRERRARRAQED